MQPRHKIDKEYNSNPRHLRRWELTIEWLKQFEIKGACLDCGDKTHFTDMINRQFKVIAKNTTNDLDWLPQFKEVKESYRVFNNVFIFEVVEHLLNPFNFLNWVRYMLDDNGSVYLSTPINRPKWMRNKELHFHEFNYNELIYLIDQAGFKIVDERRINPTQWRYIFTGIRPFVRRLGFDKNILMRLKRREIKFAGTGNFDG